MINKTISIIGCGWLGLPLGIGLTTQAWQVKGSTRQEEKLDILKTNRIQPFLLNFNPEPQGNWQEAFNSEILIINIPPGVRRYGEDFHIEQMKHLLKCAKKAAVKKIIYISSTSVYPENTQIAKEQDVSSPADAMNKTLAKAEEMVREAVDSWLILRCGGLLGYDRIPGKYFAGREVEQGGKPVNYIHRDDVITIIEQFLSRQDGWNEVYNLVAPHHPARKDIYEYNARKFGFDPITFKDVSKGEYKIVDSSKVAQTLNYDFHYPNPLEFKFIL